MAQLWMQLTSQLSEKVKVDDERYQQASKRSAELNAALVRVEMAHETSNGNVTEEEAALDKLVRETALSPDFFNNSVHDTSPDSDGKVHPRAPRRGNLGNKMEDYARYKAFRHFLSEEKLLSPNASCFVTTDDDTRNILTDEEYLGACISLCHDLAKHGVTRASNAVDDASAVPFIKSARDAVSLILEELLEFDFRNGPLRRKYDSLKYALKTLETVLYELSVAGAVGGHENLVSKGDTGGDGGPTKKMKLDEESKADEVTMQEASDDSPTIPKEEISAIRERMDARDKLREKLIKTCRDGQKAAKQSIFAMHRGDTKKASKLLQDCESCVKNDLIPILMEEPTLRYGSFSGVLEEYVEGALFYSWLYGDEGNGGKGPKKQPVGKILLPDEMPLKITTEDYLGGLADLTGEIGRFAVARGTVRDKESVKLCLESNKAIHNCLKMMGWLPRNISKKVGMVSKSVEKLERLLYEQSLMEMTGRKEFASGVEADPGYDNNTVNN